MSDTFDAVVAGAGPAGSAAATILAGHGLSVALLDKARFPRAKLCGGLLTWKTMQALAKIFGLALEDLEQDNIVHHRTHRYAVQYKGGAVARGRSAQPFVLVDRVALDHLLVRRAVEAGVRLMEQTQVRHSSPETGEVATADGRVFSGRVLLGCDGVASRVRRSLPLTREDRQAWNKGMARAVECRISREDAPAALRDLDHPRLYLGFVRAGYGWVFPNRDHLVAGQCALADPNLAFARATETFFSFLGLDPGGLSLAGHPLPYGNHLARPGHGRTLLCGDAAGLVEPTLGEGIFYALQSGRHAARSALEALETNPDHPDPVDAYLARLRGDVLPELAASNRLRWTMLGLLNVLGPWPLKLFFAFPNARLAEMVHGLRSYSWLRRKRWDF